MHGRACRVGELLSILEEVLTACCAVGKIYIPIYQLLSAFLYWKCQTRRIKESIRSGGTHVRDL